MFYNKKMMKTCRIGIIGFVLSAPFFLLLKSATAQTPEPTDGLIPWAVHAHRYQDFRKNKTSCEVFGEVKNTGTKAVKGFTLHLELLDKNGKPVAKEDLKPELRVIERRNARGKLRPVQPGEFGNFIQDTANCPKTWQDGRIRYKITAVETE